jgi:transposase
MLRLELDDTQRAELRQLARQAVGRVCERAHFVLLAGQGYTVPEIGQLMGYDPQTVRAWLKRYQAQGCSGLADAPRSGRPVQVPHLWAVLQAQASQPPPNAGYFQACWTVALLVWHLAERFRLSVSPGRVRQALRQAGFVWKRPKLAPARRPDPLAAEKEAKIAAALADPTATLIAEDEADFHLLPLLRAMWQRRGQQVRIPTPGQNTKRGVFGALNLRTGEWFYELAARKRSADFTVFLNRLTTAYPTGLIYVLLDNASIHTSQAVRQWLAAQGRVVLLYLPTYSGHRLNPVEKVWWALKATIAANRAFANLAALDAAVRRYFANFLPAHALTLTNGQVVRRALTAAAKT